MNIWFKPHIKMERRKKQKGDYLFLDVFGTRAGRKGGSYAFGAPIVPGNRSRISLTQKNVLGFQFKVSNCYQYTFNGDSLIIIITFKKREPITSLIIIWPFEESERERKQNLFRELTIFFSKYYHSVSSWLYLIIFAYTRAKFSSSVPR